MAVIGKSRPTVDKEKATTEKKKFQMADLVIPVLSFFILVLLTIFVYIPNIVEVVELRKENADVQSKQEQLSNSIRALQPFTADKIGIEQDLKVVTDVIPTSLDVADFSFYVDKLAQESGLTFKEVSSGNVDIVGNTQSQLIGSNISGVSGPIVYEGSYAKIVDFLDRLQRESPYIIETSSINMSRSSSNSGEEESAQVLDLWRVELTITGFYIKDLRTPLTSTDLYQPLVLYTTYTDILDVFEAKAEQLNK